MTQISLWRTSNSSISSSLTERKINKKLQTIWCRSHSGGHQIHPSRHHRPKGKYTESYKLHDAEGEGHPVHPSHCHEHVAENKQKIVDKSPWRLIVRVNQKCFTWKRTIYCTMQNVIVYKCEERPLLNTLIWSNSWALDTTANTSASVIICFRCSFITWKQNQTKTIKYSLIIHWVFPVIYIIWKERRGKGWQWLLETNS